MIAGRTKACLRVARNRDYVGGNPRLRTWDNLVARLQASLGRANLAHLPDPARIWLNCSTERHRQAILSPRIGGRNPPDYSLDYAN
jgi:hypothetical protein